MIVRPSFSMGAPYTRLTVTVSWAFSRIAWMVNGVLPTLARRRIILPRSASVTALC